jgi:large subunit ribosomal protein L6
MSRIGKQPIPLPKGVELLVEDGVVTVKGPKGQLSQRIDPSIAVEVVEGNVVLRRRNEERKTRAQHGLARSLIHNMVVGVTQGYQKTLDIIGVGYRAQMQGKTLQVLAGYSHPVNVEPVPGIEFEVEADARAKTNRIVVRGIDKQLVGQVAANLRGIRPPEPYKGKGIRYLGETIQRKMGKAGKAGKK